MEKSITFNVGDLVMPNFHPSIQQVLGIFSKMGLIKEP